MRSAAIWVLLACGPALAQVVVDQRRLGPAMARLEDGAGPDTLRCSATALRPSLNYSFRFQAGYVLTIPMSQFEGAGHRWRMITRVTPDSGDRAPVYLMANYRLPNVPKTKVALQVGGGYLLGEGVYHVRHLLMDEAGRTCRKDWTIDVHRSRSESKVKVAIPPNTVWDVALRGLRVVEPGGSDDAAPLRLTILLHAAPTFPRRTRLRQNDILMLLASVTSLIERVPAKNIRLVAFNLDQQKELYRKDGFLLRDVPAVADAMTHTELGLVDVKVLRNRRGHVETIADLVNQELKSDSDVVVFLGPTSRFDDKVPQGVLEKPEGRSPQFLFFDLVPMFGRMAPGMVAPSMPADSIRNVVSKVGGKTVVIRTPGDLAKAIDRLEKTPRVGSGAN